MSRKDKNSKKEQPTSSERDDDNLPTIEEEIPEVSGEQSPHSSVPFGFYLDPNISAQVEEFAPLQEIFLKTLLEASTKHMLQAHQ